MSSSIASDSALVVRSSGGVDKLFPLFTVLSELEELTAGRQGILQVIDNFLPITPGNTDGSNAIHAYLQAALDYAAANNIAEVELTRPGTFAITSTVTIPKDVLLTLGPKTTIKVAADVDGLQILGGVDIARARSGIRGGIISHASNSQTKALVLFDGLFSAGGIAPFFRTSNIGLWDTILVGNSNTDPDGIGIHLKAVGVSTTRSVVQFLKFNNVTLVNLDTGILLECTENDSALQCYCNGNMFSNITFEKVRKWTRYNSNVTASGVAAITGNQFVNVVGQSSDTITGQRWIVAEGNYTQGIKGNSYVNFYPYDGDSVPVDDRYDLIQLPTDTYGFLFTSSNALSEEFFTNPPHQSNHTVITGNPREAPRLLPAHDVTWDPARYQNVLSHYITGKNNALMFSDGAQFLPVFGQYNGKITITTDHTFTTAELMSGAHFANDTGGSATPIVWNIGTNSAVGSELIVERRDATQPITVQVGAGERIFDPVLGQMSDLGATLTFDTQWASALLRRVASHWIILYRYKNVNISGALSFLDLNEAMTVWVNSEPVSGTYTAGTRFLMKAPAAGAVAAWIMTTTGDLATTGVKKVLQTVAA